MKKSIAGVVLSLFCSITPFAQAQNLTNYSTPNSTSLSETTTASSATHMGALAPPTVAEIGGVRIVPAIIAPSFAFMAILSYGCNLVRYSTHRWNDPVGVFTEAFTSKAYLPAVFTLGLSLGSVLSGSFLTYDLVRIMSPA